MSAIVATDADINPGRDYARLRERGATHAQAVVGIADQFGVSPGRVEARAASEQWQVRYENVTALAVLDDRTFDQAYRLRELLSRWRECGDVLDATYLAAQARGATDKDVAKWRHALLSWTEMWDRLVTAEAEVRQRVLESRLTETARSRFFRIKEDLLAAYGDNGPQYRLLVELVADAKVRLEETRSSGRRVETTEFAELVRLVVAGMEQLQKYTEATKVEAIKREVNQTVMLVFEIVEHELVDLHPRLWQTIAHKVDERLTSAGDDAA